MKTRFLLAALVILASVIGFTSRAKAKDIPDQAYISGVVGHAQQYTLSCEARSAADWAAYWGVNIDETEFLNNLPRSDNPNEGFVGNPGDVWGYTPPSSYGVHADPVAATLRSYGLDAHAGLALSWDEVREEIAEGRPVIVWVIGQIWAGTASEYETEDGQTVIVANNEHTMIVVGYDEIRVHLVDALTGYTVTHTIENFLNSWSVLGNMAVVGEGSGSGQPADQPIAQGEGNYVVQRGDTLGKIANRMGVFWPDLAAWNNISYPYVIYPGQLLVTNPDGSEIGSEGEAEPDNENYTVQPGDLIADVARGLDVNWLQLAQANQITPPFILTPDSKLAIPNPNNEFQIENPEQYTAARNESLIGIANYYGLDWYQIANSNNITFPYLLAPGQTIHLQ